MSGDGRLVLMDRTIQDDPSLDDLVREATQSAAGLLRCFDRLRVPSLSPPPPLPPLPTRPDSFARVQVSQLIPHACETDYRRE